MKCCSGRSFWGKADKTHLSMINFYINFIRWKHSSWHLRRSSQKSIQSQIAPSVLLLEIKHLKHSRTNWDVAQNEEHICVVCSWSVLPYRWICALVYCMFSSQAKNQKLSDACAVCDHPKDEGWNVQPRAARSGCCAWHLGPCLTAGIGVEPAASLRARCCFIYLKAQVTFPEECRRETCLKGLSAFPLFSSVTYLPVKYEIESHQACLYCTGNRPSMNLWIWTMAPWFSSVSHEVWMVPLMIAPFEPQKRVFSLMLMFVNVASFYHISAKHDWHQGGMLIQCPFKIST